MSRIVYTAPVGTPDGPPTSVQRRHRPRSSQHGPEHARRRPPRSPRQEGGAAASRDIVGTVTTARARPHNSGSTAW